MDPLSILAFAGSVTKLVYQVSTTLYTSVQTTKTVDQTVHSLCAEVDGISHMLDGISARLKSPSLTAVRLVTQNEENDDLWETVLGSIIDCRGTLERFHKALNGIREKPTSGPSWLKQSNRQFKLNLHDDDVRTYRSQLHTYNMALQITLQMINVYVNPERYEGVLTGGIHAIIGASVENVDYAGSTLLHCATHNQKDVIQLFLNKGATLDKKYTIVGDIPLQYTIAPKHEDVVRPLVDAGARVRTTNLFGATPLHYAAQLGLKDLCRNLLRKGSNPDVKDKKGRMRVDYVHEDKELTRVFTILAGRLKRKAP
ncbi:hypothetical protein MMC26_007160 [Xylographa opegraphella]|nr:hypothetical protein [Xylographa opegraphella]